MIALIDCNNFFASCEKTFKPMLKDKPVIVLSNNDGCVVARSKESKQLGIPMGVPLFKIKKEVAIHKIQVFSSNFSLYSDMSRRIMKIIRDEFGKVEIYSIDEAFIDLSAFTKIYATQEITDKLRTLRDKIFQYTGIPVSIGIARTKTLAKAANEFAKKREEHTGVLNLVELEEEKFDELLSNLPINDIWGIGYKYTQWLRMFGINTALQLKNFDRFLMKKKFGVIGERIILELNDIEAIEVDTTHHDKKSILSSRSFPKDISDKSIIHRAISYHTSKVAEKLRKQSSSASIIGIFLKTNKFKEGEKTTICEQAILAETTSYTPELVNATTNLLNKIFDSSLAYKKCGVVVFDIRSSQSELISLFDDSEKIDRVSKNDKLMEKFDSLNKKWGQGTIKVAAEGYENDWKMRQELRSPRYTTSWTELPICS